MKIALIEDEPDCYENYEIVLRRNFNHDVKVYYDADAVIDELDEICDCDLIILDLMIQLGTKIRPDEAQETGIAIYKRIRKKSTQIPIIIITAISFSDIVELFKNDKKLKYLGKPLSDHRALNNAITEWV